MESVIVNLIQSMLDYLNNCFADILTHLQTTPADFGGGGAWDSVSSINAGIQDLYSVVDYQLNEDKSHNPAYNLLQR